jgi:putative MATE family efflux protein
MDTLESEDLRRTVAGVAFPVVLRTSLNMFMQMVDMMMVGSLGAVALAAVGLGNQVFIFMIAAAQAFSIGTTTLVAQSVGCGDLKQAKKFASQSLVAVLIVTFILGIAVAIFSRQIINGIVFFMPEKDFELISLSSTYLGILGLSMCFRFTQVIANGIFQGAGDTRTPLYLMIFSNILNIAGNYLLIFGIGPFPELGVMGAALATAGASVVTAVIGIVLLFSHISPIPLSLKLRELFSLQKETLAKVLSVGMPAAIEQIGIHFSQILFSMSVASLGSAAMAANQIVVNAYNMTRIPGIGFQAAATVLVGQSLGAEKRERALKAGMETMRLALFVASVALVIFLFFPNIVTHLFTSDVEVLALTRSPFILLALAQPAIAFIFPFTGGLRGAGDTRWVMYLTLSFVLGVRVVLTFALVAFGLGLTGVWLAMLIESNFSAILLYRRFQTQIPNVETLVRASV